MIVAIVVYSWIVVAIRVRLTMRRPEFGRIAMTMAFVGAALAITVRTPIIANAAAAALHSVNASHLLFRFAAYLAVVSILFFC